MGIVREREEGIGIADNGRFEDRGSERGTVVGGD